MDLFAEVRVREMTGQSEAREEGEFLAAMVEVERDRTAREDVRWRKGQLVP